MKEQLKMLLDELLEDATSGQILVLGCSTSEVVGGQIGKCGNMDVAHEIVSVVLEYARAKGLFLAVQCCEHLNRALVVERCVAKEERLNIVAAHPVSTAGGSAASLAFDLFSEPCLVEHIHADFGLDIGLTMIGMHLKHVAVPFRGSISMIGKAHVVAATTRPPFIGGERAKYPPK